jgi:hypothetical protein
MASIKKCCARSHFTGRAKCCDNCDCEERREAGRIYQKEYRAKQKEKEQGLGKLKAVPDIPQSRKAPAPTTVKTQYKPGPIGENALTEIARIDGAAERNPLIVALIMRVAHEIDSGEAQQLASAANTIKRLMDDLRSQSRPAGDQSAEASAGPGAAFWADWRQAGGA